MLEIFFQVFSWLCKYFNDSAKPLLIKPPKLTGSTKILKKFKYVSLMVNEKYINTLDKYSEICDKIKELEGKDFDVLVISKNECIITIIKFCNNEFETDFHDKGLPVEQTICLHIR